MWLQIITKTESQKQTHEWRNAQRDWKSPWGDSKWQPVCFLQSKRLNCVLSRQQQHHVLVTGTAPAAADAASSASPTYSEDIEQQGKEELSKRGRAQLQYPLNWSEKRPRGRGKLKEEESWYSRVTLFIHRRLQHHLLPSSHTHTHTSCSCPSLHHRALSRLIYSSGIWGKPWKRHNSRCAIFRKGSDFTLTISSPSKPTQPGQTSQRSPDQNEEGAPEWSSSYRASAQQRGDREGGMEGDGGEGMATQEGWEEAAGLLDVLVPQDLDLLQATWETGLPALCLGRPAAEEWGMKSGSACVAVVSVCVCGGLSVAECHERPHRPAVKWTCVCVWVCVCPNVCVFHSSGWKQLSPPRRAFAKVLCVAAALVLEWKVKGKTSLWNPYLLFFPKILQG